MRYFTKRLVYLGSSGGGLTLLDRSISREIKKAMTIKTVNTLKTLGDTLRKKGTGADRRGAVSME